MLVKLNVVVTLILVLSIMEAVPATASSSPIAKDGCQSQCGNFTIHYPFGMGSTECFYNDWFEVLCYNNERPHIRTDQNGVDCVEVLENDDVFIDDERGLGIGSTDSLLIRRNRSVLHVCEDTSESLGANMTGTPFHYSPNDNEFVLVGNGVAKLFSSGHLFEGGCTSISDGRGLHGALSSSDYCSGVNCCQDSLYTRDDDEDEYPAELTLNYSNSLTGKNTCAFALISDPWYFRQNAYLFSNLSADLSGVSVPVEVEWKIPISMPGHGFQNNTNCMSDGYYWYCQCPCGFNGNPYIVDGCQDRSYSCTRPYLQRNLKSVVVGGVLLLIVVLIATSYLLYKTIRRRRSKNLKKKRFKRNGGPLLQKYLSSNDNIMEKVRLFTGKDLDKATDHFNENRVLGRGGQGTVYKGMLHDGKIVAIKKSKSLLDAIQVEEFINEIIILSQIDHRNVVKLLGCCLELDVPLLVYEFIPNGTLYNLIHAEITNFPLSWEVRLRIILEVAEALTYLHSATTIPVYHRDIKSSNILLDENYKAKVADFGISRHIGVDQTHLTTLVKGTFGYLDPEYFQSSQFTEKSDVYSFGVVIVELLTGLKPICFSEEEESHLNLATRFLLAVEENCVHIIIDPQVKLTSNEEELEAVIRLSQRCLNMNGRNRPGMKEIVTELQSIKKSEILSTVTENSSGEGKEIEINFSGIGTSLQITTSSLDESPFLSSSSF